MFLGHVTDVRRYGEPTERGNDKFELLMCQFAGEVFVYENVLLDCFSVMMKSLAFC